MDYKDKKCLVTGHRGFIGKALCLALEERGADICTFDGDVRLEQDFLHLERQDYFFHFGSPSSQVLFKRNPAYCVDATISGFLNASYFCRENGIKLIYPSTGLLAQDRYNEYARCKKVLEDIHLGSGLDALGLRIYAGYGDGEGHKRDYASPVYLFAKSIENGCPPVIYGDGTQSRDFIHISDLVDTILLLSEDCNEPIVQIGSGISTSFNEIVEIANRTLGTDIEPIYIPRPNEYYDTTCADTSMMRRFYCEPKIYIESGISKILGK